MPALPPPNTSAPDELLDVLERMTDAFNARDMQQLTAFFHPDAEIHPGDQYLPPGISYHGRDGLRSMFRAARRSLPNARLSICRPRVLGDVAAACMCAAIPGQAAVQKSHWLYSFDGSLIRRVEQLPSDAWPATGGNGGPPLLFTPREREVFQLLARGLTGPQIAERLVLSPETVRTHVQNGVERLGASTRVQAVAIAIARGEIRAS